MPAAARPHCCRPNATSVAIKKIQTAGRMIMTERSTICAVAAVLAGWLTAGSAAAAEAKYPDWSGQWVPVVAPGVTVRSLDPTKPAGTGQQAPLTPQHQTV